MTFDPYQHRPGRTHWHIMTTHDEATETWRDLADHLTAEQIAQLERLEHGEPQELVAIARQWAAEKTTNTVLFDDIPPPAGAVRTFGWKLDGNWFRDFEGTTRHVGLTRVHIWGRQQADGSSRRWIAIHGRHLDALEAAAARELAVALTEAAEEIEHGD